MNNKSNNFNLEDRTAKLGEDIIKFYKSITPDFTSIPLITQLIRSATSIGANYMEANDASSKKDFQNKIYIYIKEAQETKHWLRMLAAIYPDKKAEILVLWQEAQELTLIFHKINSSMKIKNFKIDHSLKAEN